MKKVWNYGKIKVLPALTGQIVKAVSRRVNCRKQLSIASVKIQLVPLLARVLCALEAVAPP